MKRDPWNRCDNCGKFIAIDDFDIGAFRKLATPATAFSAETYDTFCKKCAPHFVERLHIAEEYPVT
jgi:recombinational DNA repair protein (RecF pathway)